MEVAAAKSDIESPHFKPETSDSLIIPHLTTQKSLKHTLQEVKVVQVRTVFHIFPRYDELFSSSSRAYKVE